MYIDKDELGYWIFRSYRNDFGTKEERFNWVLNRIQEILTVFNDVELFQVRKVRYFQGASYNLVLEFNNSELTNIIYGLDREYKKNSLISSDLQTTSFSFYGITKLKGHDPILGEFQDKKWSPNRNGISGFNDLINITINDYPEYFELRINLFADFVFPICIHTEQLQLDLAKANRPLFEICLEKVHAIGWDEIEPPKDEIWKEKIPVKNLKIYLSEPFESYKKTLLKPNFEQVEEVSKFSPEDWDFIKSCCLWDKDEEILH